MAEADDVGAVERVRVVDADPVEHACASGLEVVDALPDDPYDLSSHPLVWPVTVVDEHDCARVLDAVVRGAKVVVRVGADLDGDAARRFLDEVRRALGTRDAPPGALTDDQRALLAELRSGHTLAAAAVRLGLSERTASRRLAEARGVLGVRTTAEAVVRSGQLAEGDGGHGISV